MGVMDQLKGLLTKGKKAAGGHSGQVNTGIDKAGDTVDGKTQGKYAQHVDKAQDAAKKNINEP
ncbi:MAG: antitoxin [Aldersonia sp.]|nr:antitoxin [Aldersonia sp.]